MRARESPSPEEEDWFSVDSVEKLFDEHMRKRKLGRFVLQRTDYDRASKAVDWAQLVAPEENCSPKEAVDRSMKEYFGISGERIRQVIDIVMEKLITNFNSEQKVA